MLSGKITLFLLLALVALARGAEEGASPAEAAPTSEQVTEAAEVAAEKPTEAATEQASEIATEQATEVAAEPATEAATEPATEAPTAKPTEAPKPAGPKKDCTKESGSLDKCEECCRGNGETGVLQKRNGALLCRCWSSSNGKFN